jgi:hypothetical protein
MKPTDEDVEVAENAVIQAFNEPDSNAVRAALESYTPRLIERLAREAEADMLFYAPIRGEGLIGPLANWLRSHLETPND